MTEINHKPKWQPLALSSCAKIWYYAPTWNYNKRWKKKRYLHKCNKIVLFENDHALQASQCLLLARSSVVSYVCWNRNCDWIEKSMGQDFYQCYLWLTEHWGSKRIILLMRMLDWVITRNKNGERWVDCLNQPFMISATQIEIQIHCSKNDLGSNLLMLLLINFSCFENYISNFYDRFIRKLS